MWIKQLGRTMWAPEGQGESGGSSTPPAGGSGGEGERTFTQAQLDAIVGERATRAKGAAISELLGELGLEKADDLKALVKAAKAKQASEQTEAQRLQAQLAEAQKREATTTARLRELALINAVQAAAQKVGIVDAEVALALIQGAIQFDGDGNPQGVEAALTELVKAKPFLKAQSAGSGSPTNPPRGGAMLTKEAISKMTPEQINANWPAVQAALEKGI